MSEASSTPCSDERNQIQRLDLRVAGEKTFGYFVLPDGRPRGLVVFAHGYTHSAITWRSNLRQVAQRDHVVAVAMNYRNQLTNLDRTSPDYGRSKGWRVMEGAIDSIVATRRMMRRCEQLERRTVVMYGVSMGASASGLAISRHAERANGRPLFDYWFNIEGNTDVVQFYLLARLFDIPDARQVVAAIEREFGGTYEQRRAVYERNVIINRARGIKASGIKGAVMVHATDDDRSLYNWSERMFDRLRAVGIPTQFFTVNPAGSPVRHGSEIDRTHPVIKTGFDRLAAFFSRGALPRCFQEFDVDGASGAITPDPATATC